MKVRDIMTKKLTTIAPESSLSDAACMMRDQDIGSVAVGSETSLEGFLTDRDIVIRAVSEHRDPDSTPVREVMSEDVAWCDTDASLKDAARIMEEKKIRRLLVKDKEGQPVGILSLGDLAVRDIGHDAAAEVLEEVSSDE